MKKILVSLVLLSSLIFAEEQAVDKPKPADILSLMDKAKKELRAKNKEAVVYTQTASVDASPDDEQYYDYLTSAYNQAVLQLKAQVILKKSGKMAVEEAYKFYHKTIPDDKLAAELKQQADQKLKELEDAQEPDSIYAFVGQIVDKIVSQETKNNKPKEKIEAEVEQNIFNKSFSEATIKQGFDEISGLIPYETFIVTNKNGEVEIGVLAYTTPRSIQLARDLQQGHQSKKTENEANCKSAESIAEALTDEQLESKLGLTYYYNENCRPALLAYGMDSFIKEDGMNADYRMESAEFARSMADKFISNFLNSNVSAFQKNSKVMEKVKTAMIKATKTEQGTTHDAPKKKKQTSMIKEMSQDFSSTSEMNLIGLEDARIWSIDKGDSMLVGVMRYYSMDSINSAHKEFNPSTEKSGSGGAKKSYAPNVKRSTNIEVDDF